MLSRDGLRSWKSALERVEARSGRSCQKIRARGGLEVFEQALGMVVVLAFSD